LSTRPSSRNRDLVFLDLETTGLDPDVHEVTELAAMRTSSDGRDVRGTICHKVMPEHLETASSEALQVNGFDVAVWDREAISLEDALGSFLNLSFGPVTLVAHYAFFDWGFLRNGLKRFSLVRDLDAHLLCTASMSWVLTMWGEVEKPKLDLLCDYYEIPNVGAHRALHDVERTRALYRKLLQLQPSRIKPLSMFDESSEEYWGNEEAAGLDPRDAG